MSTFRSSAGLLTGVTPANRHTTDDAVDCLHAAAWRGKRPLGVVLVDLDLFTQVNDRHGHDGGDQLLAAVATAVPGAVRTGGLVGRVGGEEFLALLPDTDLTGTVLVAEYLRGAVAALDVGPIRCPAVRSPAIRCPRW